MRQRHVEAEATNAQEILRSCGTHAWLDWASVGPRERELVLKAATRAGFVGNPRHRKMPAHQYYEKLVRLAKRG